MTERGQIQSLAHRQKTRYGPANCSAVPIRNAAQIGGSARGYRAIFVPLAALSSPSYGAQWTVSQPYIYASPRLR